MVKLTCLNLAEATLAMPFDCQLLLTLQWQLGVKTKPAIY